MEIHVDECFVAGVIEAGRVVSFPRLEADGLGNCSGGGIQIGAGEGWAGAGSDAEGFQDGMSAGGAVEVQGLNGASFYPQVLKVIAGAAQQEVPFLFGGRVEERSGCSVSPAFFFRCVQLQEQPDVLRVRDHGEEIPNRHGQRGLF